ncbi:MAG: hypothetical protein IJW21_04125 [Clostridia bacterium]|nr:hypothetical protein [Clostridia bacterium]
MKKIICCVLICAVLVLALASCGKAKFKLDGKSFTFAYAQESTKIVACSSANATLYKNAEVVDYTLSADDGKLTFAGADGTVEGEYVVYETGKEYVVYEISVNGESGYASLTLKEYEDGAKEYFLLLTLSEHTVQFTSGKFTE